VWSTVRHAIHFQFHISSNVLEIRAVQSPMCIVLCAVVSTSETPILYQNVFAHILPMYKSRLKYNSALLYFILYTLVAYYDILGRKGHVAHLLAQCHITK
jgi:hypothetical protein